MIRTWVWSKGWCRLVCAFMLSRRPVLQLKKLRLQCQAPGRFWGIALWRKKVLALTIWKYWLSEVETQMQLGKIMRHRWKLLAMGSQVWELIWNSRTFWMLPSPGGSGVKNYLCLSSTSRSMMRFAATTWSKALQYHPASVEFARAKTVARLCRRCALLQRTILIMGKRLDRLYDENSPRSITANESSKSPERRPS